jgi:hypothetical protein
MDSESHQSTTGLLGMWVLANGISWVAGAIITIILSYSVIIIYPEENNLLVGLGLGGAVGFAQWLVFRKRLSISSRWILYSVIGLGIPFIIGVVLEQAGTLPDSWAASEAIAFTLVGSVGGLIAGLLQSHILRPYSSRAGWWVAFSTLGWGVTWLSVTAISEIVWIIGGVILGIVTGYPLLWILNSPVAIQPEKQISGIEDIAS